MEAILVCIVIAVAVAFLVTGIMKAQLKSVRPQRSASSYVVPGSFRLHQSHDLFLYRNVTRRPRQTDNKK